MSGLIIAMSVLGAVGVVAGASLYFSNTESTKNPYDLTDQYGNTRTGLYNQWNPTPQVQNEYVSYSAGSKTKRNKKNTKKRHNKNITRRHKKNKK
jgi:hypothetical protein